MAGFKPAIAVFISTTALKPQLRHCINVYALYICGNNECCHIYHPEVVRTASEPKNKEQQEKHSRLSPAVLKEQTCLYRASLHISTHRHASFTQYKPDQAHSDSSHTAAINSRHMRQCDRITRAESWAQNCSSQRCEAADGVQLLSLCE